jgi:plasmid stabilization system protein ParE
VSRTVVLLPRARRQLAENVWWWSENRSANQAFQWLEKIEQTIAELKDTALRHAFAPENDAFAFELRQCNFGLGRHPTHRILFEVRGDEVLVYAVRHLAQDQVSSEDLQQP